MISDENRNGYEQRFKIISQYQKSIGAEVDQSV
jgi:hypothetical protein